MKILYVVPYTPNPIRTRPFNLLRSLQRRGDKVVLATLWENAGEREALRVLEQEGITVISERLTKDQSLRNALLALPTGNPLQSVYCWQPALLRQIKARLADEWFDVIHVEHLRGARYGLELKSFLRGIGPRPALVWDSVDCISYLFEQAVRSSRSPFGRLVTRLELNRTRRYESWLVGQFDRVLVTSPRDKIALEGLASKNRPSHNGGDANSNEITVLPNGVDLNTFTPMRLDREPDTLVFTGKMSYHANVTAALYLVQDIMPLIWAERPSVRVWIVGKDPTAAIRQLAAQRPGQVLIPGTVPDLRPYLARAAVAVCPMEYGAGIQNKVLEAMAMATPVVATPQAVSALQVHDGEHLLVSEGPAAFAQTVMRALSDPERNGRIGQAGRRYVEQCHDWRAITGNLQAIYQQTVTQYPAFSGAPIYREHRRYESIKARIAQPGEASGKAPVAAPSRLGRLDHDREQTRRHDQER